jgi:hypothetical protein
MGRNKMFLFEAWFWSRRCTTPSRPYFVICWSRCDVVDDIAVTDEKNGETSHNQEATSRILLHLIERKLLPQTRCCGDVERRKRWIKQTAKRAGRTNLLSSRLWSRVHLSARQTRCCGGVEWRKRWIKQATKRAGRTNLLSSRLWSHVHSERKGWVLSCLPTQHTLFQR